MRAGGLEFILRERKAVSDFDVFTRTATNMSIQKLPVHNRHISRGQHKQQQFSWNQGVRSFRELINKKVD